MAELTYTVEGMTCAHCAGAVSREVGRIEGVDDVRVDVAAGLVTIQTTGAVSDDAVAAAVDDAGYTVVATR
ncbi:MAG: cation-transporting ATPase [Microbacterium sp. SCN 70-27]|uniref:heavy-metal-associated domain-containing protein n=1 Tax=unclassified Microbacterium TaxID=2609290 RepID=UPI00086C9614|nr:MULTISPECIES: heavy-metal-associated domain-containing protein [unclassified Microbacterium]MBN9224533.1 heavy-metal-associated domain-containing protein [Microbacterium sp.]ODT27089.1 MAG: cation-transporting ATPase [Microbacterium sp. SCN 70-27]